MALEIRGVTSGPVATNAWLVSDAEQKGSVIIDAPPDSAQALIRAADETGVTPGAIILTHTHWDHTADVAALQRHWPELLVYVHPDDEYRLAEPMKHTVWALPFVIEGIKADRHLHHGDTFAIGGLCFAVLHTPGHTEGGICLYDADHATIFVGDTLFADSVGRTDLPGGSWERLIESITRELLVLPDKTAVYTGHGPSTTIGRERETNPFLG